MKFIFSISFFTLVCLLHLAVVVTGDPIMDENSTVPSSSGIAKEAVVVEDCDALHCADEKKENLICAASETGSIASFHSECGVNLINCYQRVYNAPKYHIISRKACAHKDVMYMRGKCDKLKCDNGDQEKAVCATNGTGTGLFKSACHIEILNCYQKIYARPQYRIVASKNCANIQGWQ